MSQRNDQSAVYKASQAFVGTCGESRIAGRCDFVPAFRNEVDGRIELARLANGQPAPMHLIAKLPQAWALRHDAQGNVLELLPSITAGFVRGGKFYTREQAAQINTGQQHDA